MAICVHGCGMDAGAGRQPDCDCVRSLDDARAYLLAHSGLTAATIDALLADDEDHWRTAARDALVDDAMDRACPQCWRPYALDGAEEMAEMGDAARCYTGPDECEHGRCACCNKSLPLAALTPGDEYCAACELQWSRDQIEAVRDDDEDREPRDPTPAEAFYPGR